MSAVGGMRPCHVQDSVTHMRNTCAIPPPALLAAAVAAAAATPLPPTCKLHTAADEVDDRPVPEGPGRAGAGGECAAGTARHWLWSFSLVSSFGRSLCASSHAALMLEDSLSLPRLSLIPFALY